MAYPVKLGAALAFFPAACLLSATDLETQHALDFSFPLAGRLDVLLHTRFRTTTNGQGLYQIRSGPVFTFDATERLSLLGGYYYSTQEARDNDFVAGHRMFGGAEGTLWGSRRASLELRGIYERFLPEAEPNYNRYRARTRVTLKGRWSPYLSSELFFDDVGFRSARYAGGVRWRAARAVQFDFGYFFEERAARIGFDRHMIMTSVHFRVREKGSADPDL